MHQFPVRKPLGVPTSPTPVLLLRILAVTAAYLIAASISLPSPTDAPDARLFWFPAGVALALLVRWGLGIWPGILLGGIIVDSHLGHSPTFAFLEPIGKTLGSVAAAWWLRRAGFQGGFPRREDVIAFCAASVVGMAIPPTWGVFWLALGGLVATAEAALATWSIWWLGDTVGVLLMAPFLLSLGAGCFDPVRERPREFALWALLALAAVAAMLISPSSVEAWITLALLPVPLMVWAVIRFGLSVASLWVLALTGVGMVEATLGQGVFRLESSTEALLILWAYLASFVIIGLFITALQNEQRDVTLRLRQTTSLQSLLIKLATGFLNTPEESLDVAIDNALAELGTLTGADRAYVFRYDHDSRTMSNTHEWCQPGVESEKENLQELSYDLLPDWERQHGSDRIIHVPNVQELPRESPMRAILESQGIKTLITVPMIAGGVCLGFVGFDDVRRLRAWSQDEKNILRVLAEIITNIEVRRRQSIALQRSRAEYESVVRYQRELVCRYLPDTTLTFVNDAYCRWAGRAREDLLGRRFIELRGGSDEAGMLTRINRIIETGESNAHEHASIAANGAPRWHLWTDVLLPADPGGRVELQSVGIDITERKLAEDASSRYREMLQEIIDLLPAYIFAKDAEGRFIFINKSLADFFKTTPREVIGKRDEDFGANAEQAEKLRAEDRKVMEEGHALFLPEVPVPFSRQHMGWFQSTKVPFELPLDKSPAVLGVAVDITDRLLAEKSIRESEERLRAIGDNLPDGAIYRLHQFPDGTIEVPYISAGIERILGHAAAEVMRNPLIMQETLHPDDVADFELASIETLRTLEPYDHTWRYRHKDGTLRWLHMRSTSWRTQDGGLIADGVATDVTTRILAEEAVRQGERLMRALSDNMPTIALIRLERSPEGVVRITHITRGIEHILERAAEDFVGGRATINSCLPPDTRERYLELARKCVETLEDFVFEAHRQRANGEDQWIEVRVQQRMEGDGTVVSEGVIIDITARRRIEEALRQEQNLVVGGPALVIVWSPEAGSPVLYVSRNLPSILGYSTEQFLDPAFRYDSLMHPDELPAIGGEARRFAGERRESWEQGYRLRHADGGYRWFSDFTVPEYDTDGRLLRIRGYLVDKTSEMRAEEQILAQKEQLDNFFRVTRDLLAISDTQGRFVRLNPEWEKLLGYPLSELEGRHLLEMVHEDDVPRTREALDALKRGENVYSFQNRCRRSDDTYRSLEWRAHILEDSIYAAARDITDRIQYEEALRASEATLRSYIEHAPMGVLVTDAEARYIDANSIGLEMLRCTREELLARNVWDFVAPSSMEPGREMFRRMIGGEVVESEILLRRADGHEFWARSYAVALGPDRYMSFIVDITGEHEMERVRLRMEEDLRQAQKMEAIGLLAGGVAHDFNNMLQVIQSHADIVLEDLDEMSPVREDLNQIRRAAARSTELVRQLLAFSRKQAVEPRVVDLNAIIRDRASMLRRLIDPRIGMRFEPVPDVWPVRIDTSQIDQILTNLVVNARDAIAGSGSIAIHTRNRIVDEEMAASRMGLGPGAYAAILVEDTGQGMDAATLSRVFEPFFTTKKHGMGTGLGLATVYGIVKQNNGCITISSQPGTGTLVEVLLPRHYGKPTPDSAPEPRGPKPVARETILVVEDEPSILRGVSRILEAHGYTVLGAGTGTRAQELAASHAGPVHLLLSDVVMPQMNGRELQEKILVLRPDIRTLFMSGYSADVISKDGEVAPNIAFVQKPFTILQLTRKIREVLDA